MVSTTMFRTTISVLLLLQVAVCVRAQNCTVQCTTCATDIDVLSGNVEFNVAECTQQCEQSLEDATMWKLCRSMAVWTRMDDPSEELRSTLKWQHVLAIVVCIVLIAFCITAAVLVYCVGCRNRSKTPTDEPRRCSYSREPTRSRTDEADTAHPV
ncbi:uncharacterized protein [Branchiostoma lanceolatum]|uniref:uncharacterized protein n=1 Tax=Branchiostoma lanceolatum TaxID=7740 RepID=UPI003453A902